MIELWQRIAKATGDGLRPTTPAAARHGFTCPRCTRTSHHPKDKRYGYCSHCHDYTGVPTP